MRIVYLRVKSPLHVNRSEFRRLEADGYVRHLIRGRTHLMSCPIGKEARWYSLGRFN